MAKKEINKDKILWIDLEMTGLEATQRIRSLVRTDAKIVPVIAMTGDASEQKQQAAKAVGMTEYLLKPIEMEKLVQVLLQTMV